MKKAILLAVAGALSVQAILAQTPANPRPGNSAAASAASQTLPKGNSKIAGVILDESAKQAIEFATVTLVDKSTGKTVDGTISDDRGRFSIRRIATGQYKLSVTFLDYETKIIDNLAIDKGEVNVGTLTLKPDAKSLQEVAVLGEKALLEDKVDRLVYNAEKDITNTGGTASEVLKKVPGLTVDLEGNVALRGSSNIRVLINNKPSTVMATSMADALILYHNLCAKRVYSHYTY